MNLFYLVANKNERFEQSREIAKFRMERNGLMWRGVKIEPGKGRIYLERATQCQPFRGRCGYPGWFVQGVGGDSEVVVRFIADGKTVAKRRLKLGSDSFEPIALPWPVEPFAGELNLEIACHGPAAAFVASHYDLDRKLLFDRCRGKGAELGPGPNPHILPSTTTEIVYVEQKSPADWVRLYGDHYKVAFKPELTPHYIVGEAHSLPVEPGTLDFIYSSHVFEHLVNPLGHLVLWSTALRKGGEVLMVVPDYIGSKDFLVEASTLEELVAEEQAGDFAPSIDHYHKYARARNSPAKAQALYDDKASIHMHYYSNDNMQQLLERSVRQGHFASFTILHSPNAKDFHVILAK